MMLPINGVPAPQDAEKTAVVISGSAESLGQVLYTEPGLPDIAITVVKPVMAILVRVAKTYLQTLLGLLSAAGFGVTILTPVPGDFFATLRLCAGLAIASGVMSLLTNILLLLTAMGDKYPTLKS